jgi:hypothetical protein
MLKSMQRVHKGEERLLIAFWGYFILVGLIISVFTDPLFEAASQAQIKPIGVLLGLIIFAVTDSYFAWSIVAIWRCAYNVNRKLWGHVTRAVAALAIVAFLEGLYEQYQWLQELT